MNDWRNAARCRDEDPELFFPIGESAGAAIQAEEAKAVCGRCPVTDECLRWALDERIEEGIFGALTGPERRSTHRRQARRSRLTPMTHATTQQDRPKTLEEAFNRRAHGTDDGHTTWEGSPTFKFQGAVHNALRVAFTLGHGREPEGPVDRTCCSRNCYTPAHLIDTVLRDAGALCGTQRGYYRHHRIGEHACDPCKEANAAADNQPAAA